MEQQFKEKFGNILIEMLPKLHLGFTFPRSVRGLSSHSFALLFIFDRRASLLCIRVR